MSGYIYFIGICLIFRYETHHGVRILDSALVDAAKLSHRYISGRRLPDKAIDLVDEACALVRVELDSRPQELDRVRHHFQKKRFIRVANWSLYHVMKPFSHFILAD